MPDAEVSPTPAPTTATPEPGPAANGTGTATTSGSQTQGDGGPSGDTFYNGDPNSLPAELQPAYKNMLKDYKEKTQAIAESRKKAEAYDKLQQDEQIQAYLKGLSRGERSSFKDQKAEMERSLGERISDED